MVQIDTTRMSSRGQIVIPQRMRDKFKEGDIIIVIENGNQLILKKESEMDKSLKEELEFAHRTEEAWKQIEEGKCKAYNLDEFLKRLRDGKSKDI